MKLHPILAALLLIITFALLQSCSSIEHRAPEIPEFRSNETAPLMTEPIRADSPYAGLRYLALARELESNDMFGRVFTEQTATGFKAFRNSDDSDITDQYSAWLQNIQAVLNEIQIASRLDSLFPASENIIYNRYDEEDPRRQSQVLARNLTLTLRDDSTRLWFKGDHAGSIERINSVLRIAFQNGSRDNPDVLIPLMARSIAGVSLRQFRWMLQHTLCSDDDRELIRQSIEMVGGYDPFQVKQTTGLYILAVDKWITTQLEVEGGSDEFWYHYGMIHGVIRFTESLFKGPFNADSMRSNIEETKLDILDYLEDIDFDDIKHAYKEYHPIAVEIGTSLVNGTANQEHISQLLKTTEDDDTGMSDIMMLSFGRTVLRNNQRFIDTRDELIRTIED